MKSDVIRRSLPTVYYFVVTFHVCQSASSELFHDFSNLLVRVREHVDERRATGWGLVAVE